MQLLFLAALLVLAACAPQAPAGSPQARGRAAYEAYGCRSCHRIGADGGASGPDLTYVGFHKSASFLDAWLADPRAWQPSTLMPNLRLPDATRRDLVAYLATLRGQAFAGAKPWDAPSVASGPATRGAVLFERAGCATCHGKAGTGGFPNNNVPGGLVPAVRETAHTYTPEELLRKVKGGVPRPQKADPSGPEPLLAMPAWGRVLTAGELDALVAYLQSLRPVKSLGF